MIDKVFNFLIKFYYFFYFLQSIQYLSGEIQGVLEQIATLAVLGGYPGSLLFGYFVSSSAPVYWPGAPFSLAALYSFLGGLFFYIYIYLNSDGVDTYPIIEKEDHSNDGLLWFQNPLVLRVYQSVLVKDKDSSSSE